MTQSAKLICVKLDNYFIKAKKKTDIQLMGKNFVDSINDYREVFPAKKLPSGKPARNNVKALGEVSSIANGALDQSDRFDSDTQITATLIAAGTTATTGQVTVTFTYVQANNLRDKAANI